MTYTSGLSIPKGLLQGGFPGGLEVDSNHILPNSGFEKILPSYLENSPKIPVCLTRGFVYVRRICGLSEE